MNRVVVISIVLFFAGCSAVNENAKKVREFSKCYIEKIPAPFWVCYQSTFMSVGKIYTETVNRLKQEEAYSKAINDLIIKLQHKTSIFLQRAKINDTSILEDVKNFVIINAIEGNSWYDKKHHILYVEASVEKKDFKNFLKEKIKIENFDKLFNEVF